MISLYKHDLLEKVMFISKKRWILKFETFRQDLKPYELSLYTKLPLSIDNIDLEEKKWSYELTNNNFYLDSYFQVVNENQFSSLVTNSIFKV